MMLVERSAAVKSRALINYHATKQNLEATPPDLSLLAEQMEL